MRTLPALAGPKRAPCNRRDCHALVSNWNRAWICRKEASAPDYPARGEGGFVRRTRTKVRLLPGEWLGWFSTLRASSQQEEQFETRVVTGLGEVYYNDVWLLVGYQ